VTDDRVQRRPIELHAVDAPTACVTESTVASVSDCSGLNSAYSPRSPHAPQCVPQVRCPRRRGSDHPYRKPVGPSGRRRSGRDFPDLMVHMVEGVQPAQRGADPIRTHRRQGRGVATKSAGSAGGGEHDAGSFQLGLNPYPFDVTLRAGRVLPKLVWDVQHLAGLH